MSGPLHPGIGQKRRERQVHTRPGCEHEQQALEDSFFGFPLVE
jgi:hypothetical protein